MANAVPSLTISGPASPWRSRHSTATSRPSECKSFCCHEHWATELHRLDLQGTPRTVSTVSIDMRWQTMEASRDTSLGVSAMGYETWRYVRKGCRKEHFPHAQDRSSTKVSISI
jgi:hypothetical protein